MGSRIQTSFFFVVLLTFILPLSSHARFTETSLQTITGLHQQILYEKKRNINGEDTKRIWALFDEEVEAVLNDESFAKDAAVYNAEFPLTDIVSKIPKIYRNSKNAQEKTGNIRIEFIPLLSRNSEGISDWLVIYYHSIGAVPASTFHIFHHDGQKFRLAAAAERNRFLNGHPSLQWGSLQVVTTADKHTITSYYGAVSKSEVVNRSKIMWEWKHETLKARSWIEHFDRHQNELGQWVDGPGDLIEIKRDIKWP